MPDGEHLVPFGKARIAREGRAITHRFVVRAGGTSACRRPRTVDAEVIDLRTLWPWDKEAVFASVEKTGRLLVVHEAVTVGGFGAEIAATVAEKSARQCADSARRAHRSATRPRLRMRCASRRPRSSRLRAR